MLALVTCSAARALDSDLPLLQHEMPEASIVAWDDDSVDWSSFDVVVIRSTWDYHVRRHDFLEWATHVSSVTALWNPVSVIDWNTDKRYLSELERQGIAIVPTSFVAPGDDPVSDALAGDVVLKPSVGAGSNGVFRTRGDVVAGFEHVRALHAAGLTAMIQPYASDVDDAGETGLVYVGGAFSHAFRKDAILATPVEFEGDLMAVETSHPHTADTAQRELGDRVLALLPETAYARIDLVPMHDAPVVLEVELTEPSLFLQHDSAAAARAADAFRNLTA